MPLVLKLPGTMFTFARLKSWTKPSARPADAEGVIQSIQNHIYKKVSKRPTPYQISAFVHRNSWHYYWETTVRNDLEKLRLAIRSWYGGDRYRQELEESQQVPPSNPDEVLGLILNAAIGGPNRYLECGHRAVATASIAESLGIEVRYVTLFAPRDPAPYITHHLLELGGEHGWELHDPDYGFCLRTKGGRVASLRQAMTEPVTPDVYNAHPTGDRAFYVDDLFKYHFFSAASTRLGDEDDVLYLSDCHLARREFESSGSSLCFADYWRRYISVADKREVIAIKPAGNFVLADLNAL